MSLVVGNRGGLGRELVQWLVLGALVGAVLNFKDIERYFKIRGM